MEPNRTIFAALLAAALACAAPAALAAQEAAASDWEPLAEPAAASGGLALSGEIEAGLGVAAGKDLAFDAPDWTDGFLGLRLEAEARPADGLRVYAEAKAEEGLPAKAPAMVAGLPSITLESPSIRVVEAWASLQDAPIRGTELRVGRQRIAWGPADQIGIVDAFDAPDFSDLASFGEKLASDAVRFRYFGRRFGLDLAWTPFWRAAPLPATMPAAFVPAAGDYSALTAIGVSVTPAAPTLATPKNNAVDSSTVGLRGTFEPEGWTIGASYVYGRSPIPALSGVVATWTAMPNPPTTMGALSVAASLEYPRRHQASLDVAGELLGLGVWAEAACVINDRDYVEDLSALAILDPSKKRTTSSDDPYWRWLAGCDYTFANDIYLNFQYLRGMAWETLPDAQNDYAVLALKWELAGGKLLLGPLAAVLEVDALDDIISGDREFSDSYGLAFSPSVSYKPYDGVELTAGLAWMLGSDSSTLGAMADQSKAYLKTKISF